MNREELIQQGIDALVSAGMEYKGINKTMEIDGPIHEINNPTTDSVWLLTDTDLFNIGRYKEIGELEIKEKDVEDHTEA